MAETRIKQTLLARTRADGTVRARAYHGYSRNGCARCKQQRVRCDERHPECNRCVRVGTKCPGYEQKLRWSDKHEVLHSVANPAAVTKPGPPHAAKVTAAAFRPSTEQLLQIIPVTPGPQPVASQVPISVPVPAPSPSALSARSDLSVLSQQRPQQRSRSSSPPNDMLETSPASLTSSSDTNELPALGGDAVTGHISLPITAQPSDSAGQNDGHRWDPAYLDMFDQMDPAIASDVPDFYMGLDSAFLAERKSQGTGMFLGGMLSLADTTAAAATPAAPASYAEPLSTVTGLSGPSIQHQPMATLFSSLSDVTIDDLWRGWSPKIAPQVVESPGVDLQPSGMVAAAQLDDSVLVDDDDSGADFSRSIPAAGGYDEPLSPYTLPSRRSSSSVSYQVARSPSPLALSINDIGTVLVEFYFKETAKIYSCYDGRMNPFRTTVVHLWSSSEIINCTAQSMAAGCLLRDFPQLAPVGRQLRQKATRILAKTKTWDTNTMLAVLMLGGTASWHDSKDLGLPFFQQIAERLAMAPASVFREGDSCRNYRFFYESMQYWEMQLAFLTEDETLPGTPDSHLLADRIFGTSSISRQRERNSWAGERGQRQREQQRQRQRQQQREQDKDEGGQEPLPLPRPRPPPTPHPWTGFAGETQRTVQKVGRLLRRQRKFDFAHRFASVAHISQLQQDMQMARELEAHLLGISHPAEHAVKDTEDGNTPVWHLLTLAELIRHMGLIQLYHVFPDLLSARLGRERSAGSGSYYNFGLEAGTAITPALCRRWLTTYTLRTMDMLRTLPVESGTRVFQPFLLVALSSELRNAGGENGGHSGRASLLGLNKEAVEVARARSFIHSRLQLFLHLLPPKPMTMCVNIVQETWAQMDRQATLRSLAVAGQGVGRCRAAAESEADVYWMDVMIENGWETVMG
ncbi:c6 zinc finger domain containing protein [Grosmannia clavigera kw1407]|uniref:C6 zinc finger domain containing protein n=1 Tax=Grosmannia clavigera (strain kw1407 / UAMH 11150) TaxID=655863 RepID=F0X7D6_GROCL|nr:c6 zinc finger domain containing protein [Grosmannia clavigera kw1407]EFX06200.1 c6 zinc finger domain containing protein [Grosmannia clavigera kw1407]